MNNVYRLIKMADNFFLTIDKPVRCFPLPMYRCLIIYVNIDNFLKLFFILATQ